MLHQLSPDEAVRKGDGDIIVAPEADKPFDLSLRIRMDCETYFTSIILLVWVKSPAVNL